MPLELQRTLVIPLGVVVARERIDHPWQEFAWRPLSVFLDADPISDWRLLQRGAGFEHYHAATLPLELHRKETAGYRVNLANGVASIYVVLREGAAGASEIPMHVHMVTASPFDVQAYGHTMEEIIGRVVMPEPLVALVQDFIAAHHVEDTFVKRQRQQHHVETEHNFGQEPLVVLREHRARAAEREAAEAAKKR